MPAPSRIAAINVTKLLGMYDYRLPFSSGSDNIIIIAPNGYGKTAFLSLINSCLQFRLREAASKSFKSLEVLFEDKTRWEFTKSSTKSRKIVKDEPFRRRPLMVRGHYIKRHIDAVVTVKFFDKAGRQPKG